MILSPPSIGRAILEGQKNKDFYPYQPAMRLPMTDMGTIIMID
jgi:hypothetical protein